MNQTQTSRVLLAATLNALILAIILTSTSCGRQQYSADFSDSPLFEPGEGYQTLLDYAENNSQTVLLEDRADFPYLAEALEGKDIFFTAEIHGTLVNRELEKRFIAFAHKIMGFRYLLSELAVSGAWFLNRYLETGDKEVLDSYFEPLRGTFAWTHDSYEFWPWLREYNLGLPADKRIIVVGVDIEHQEETALRCLSEIAACKPPPPHLASEFGPILTYHKSLTENLIPKNWLGYATIARNLQASMNVRPEDYRAWLHDDYITVQLVIDGMVNLAEIHSGDISDFNRKRDAMIYQAFCQLEPALPPGKFFGQWGLNHAFQQPEGDILWFAAALNAAESPYHNRILSLVYQYINCRSISKLGNRQYGERQLDYSFAVVDALAPKSAGELRLFRLEGESSPWNQVPMRDSSNKILDLPVSSYYQYMLSIRGSPASIPLEKRIADTVD